MVADKSDRYTDAAAREVGFAVMTLGVAMQGYRDWPMQITGLSIRGPRERGDEFLITVRAVDAEDEPFVAFHSAFDLHDALRGVKERAQNGQLKWREDTWAKK